METKITIYRTTVYAINWLGGKKLFPGNKDVQSAAGTFRVKYPESGIINISKNKQGLLHLFDGLRRKTSNNCYEKTHSSVEIPFCNSSYIFSQLFILPRHSRFQLH
jgi:hypothetical protein